MTGLGILFAISLKATVVLLLGTALCFAIRRQSSGTRMLLWNLVFGSLLALPLFTAGVPGWSPRVTRAEIMPVIHSSPVAVGLAAVPARQVPEKQRVPWGEIVITVWLTGAAIMLGRLLIGMVRVRTISKSADRITDSRIMPVVNELATRLGLAHCPVLLETDRALPPMTWGVARPIILLPNSGRKWPVNVLRMVLAHELVHVGRWDYLSQIASHFACAVYWFHPLVWFAAGQISKERELSCDDEVLNMGIKATEYAEHLVQIMRTLVCPTAVLGTVTGMLPPFEGRIAAILDSKRNRKTPRRWTAAAGAVVALGLLLPLAALRAPAQNGAKVAGVVRDPSGAAIPNAMVTLLSADKRAMQADSTDAVGRFEFSSVAEGRYSLEVSSAGFAVYRQPDVAVGPSGATGLQLVLNVGSIQEKVEVVGRGIPATHPASAPVPERIRVGGNVQASRLISKVNPVYPVQAEQAGIQGTVLLHAIVGTDGHLLSLGVANAGVNPDLANAATDAVKQWVYQPTLLNGEPVEVVTTITVVFRLKP